jgi:hypothetical protein
MEFQRWGARRVESAVARREGAAGRPVGAAVLDGGRDPRLGVLGPRRGPPPFPDGFRWLAGRDAPRYSLAVRAPLRAVRVPRDRVGGRTAPSTYDLTK